MSEPENPSTWIMTPFPIKVSGESGPETIIVGGWARGQFAIDERERRARRGKVWCITHIPTGYTVRFVVGARKVAQRLADEIAAAADWNFSDPADAKSRGAAVKAVMTRNPGSFVNSFEAGPPKPLDVSKGAA